MAATGNAEEPDPEMEVLEDERLEFLANHVMKALKANRAQWAKMQKVEENNTLLQK